MRKALLLYTEETLKDTIVRQGLNSKLMLGPQLWIQENCDLNLGQTLGSRGLASSSYVAMLMNSRFTSNFLRGFLCSASHVCLCWELWCCSFLCCWNVYLWSPESINPARCVLGSDRHVATSLVLWFILLQWDGHERTQKDRDQLMNDSKVRVGDLCAGNLSLLFFCPLDGEVQLLLWMDRNLNSLIP